jgi:hypothetical protein
MRSRGIFMGGYRFNWKKWQEECRRLGWLVEVELETKPKNAV